MKSVLFGMIWLSTTATATAAWNDTEKQGAKSQLPSVGHRNKVLEFKFRAEIPAGYDLKSTDDFDDDVFDAVMDMVPDLNEGDFYCYPSQTWTDWIRNYSKNKRCSKTAFVVVNDNETDHRGLAKDLAHAVNQTASNYGMELDWIWYPRLARDPDTYVYRLELTRPKPNHHFRNRINLIKASVMIDIAMQSALSKAGMEATDGLGSTDALCGDKETGNDDDDDDDDTDACFYIYRELYTGTNNSSQSQITTIVQQVLEQMNAKHDWFQATYVDAASMNDKDEWAEMGGELERIS